MLGFPAKLKYESNLECVKEIFEEKIVRIIDSFCVSKIGRVEAVKTSPDGKKLAYASFDLNQIIIFNFKFIERSIIIDDCVFLECDLCDPHDLAWIDNSTIVVANRSGPAVIFEVPQNSKKISPIIKIEDEMANKTNAVTVCHTKKGFNLFFCSVFNYVSCFFFNEDFIMQDKKIFFNKDLKVPDGIAIDNSKSKIAITSALNNKIIVCDLKNPDENFVELNSERPHGVDFIGDNILISTGGGDPYLNFWKIDKKTKFKVLALSKKQFKLRGSDLEGGIKGLNFCNNSKIIFATCPNAPFLAFKNITL
jgi:WD40 repeat protein